MTMLGRGFTALQHRNYRLFWWGQLISLVGTWMQTTAQAWLVLQLTGSAADLGIVTALQSLPVLFIGFFGGVIADWLPKRRLLIITQIAQMLLALILGVLVSTHTVQMWHVYLLATLLGITNAFDMPTRQAFVMEMVGREELMNAVALGSMQFNAARVVGPAIAGVSIALIGVTGSFYANGLSFVAVIVGLLMMRTSEFFEVEPAPRTSMFRSLGDGCAYVARTPVVLMITLLVGLLGLFAFNVSLLAPIFARDILHSGAVGYGGLMAGMGVGALAAAMTAAYARSAGWLLILGGTLMFCVFQIFFAFSTVYLVSLVLLLFVGYGMVMFFTAANTVVQQEVPNQLRGRVMGVYMSVNMGMMPIGNLACGFVAGAMGAVFALVSGSLLATATLAGMSGWIYAHRRSPGYSLMDEPAAIPVSAELTPDAARGPARALRESTAG